MLSLSDFRILHNVREKTYARKSRAELAAKPRSRFHCQRNVSINSPVLNSWMWSVVITSLKMYTSVTGTVQTVKAVKEFSKDSKVLCCS